MKIERYMHELHLIHHRRLWFALYHERDQVSMTGRYMILDWDSTLFASFLVVGQLWEKKWELKP